MSNTSSFSTISSSRTFLPNDHTGPDSVDVAGVKLTIDERAVITYGQERNAVEFFDSARNRNTRAIMASNRAHFLS